METSNDCFVAALQKKLKEQGHGSKKKLAVDVGISPNHLSDILAQRKNAGEKLKERIADTFTMSFEDMLVLGRRIAEGRSAEESDNESSKPLSQETKEIDNFLALASQILESDTPYRQALINNLTAFHQAMETGDKQVEALQIIASLQKELKTMRQDIENLKKHKNKGDDLSHTAAA